MRSRRQSAGSQMRHPTVCFKSFRKRTNTDQIDLSKDWIKLTCRCARRCDHFGHGSRFVSQRNERAVNAASPQWTCAGSPPQGGQQQPASTTVSLRRLGSWGDRCCWDGTRARMRSGLQLWKSSVPIRVSARRDAGWHRDSCCSNTNHCHLWLQYLVGYLRSRLEICPKCIQRALPWPSESRSRL